MPDLGQGLGKPSEKRRKERELSERTRALDYRMPDGEGAYLKYNWVVWENGELGLGKLGTKFFGLESPCRIGAEDHGT